MLRINNLCYKYDLDSGDFILNNINLSANNGDIIGVVGKTGSGKSTLLQIISNILKPSSGEIFLDNKNIHKEFNDFKKLFSNIGIVFQCPEEQIFAQTVFDDISFGLKNLGKSNEEIKIAVKEISDLLLIDKNILHKSVFELSGGEKRKCASSRQRRPLYTGSGRTACNQHHCLLPSLWRKGSCRCGDPARRIKIPRQAVCLPWEMKMRLLRLAGFNPPSRRRRQASDNRRSLRQPIRHP